MVASGTLLSLDHVQTWTSLAEPIHNIYWYVIDNFAGPVLLDDIIAPMALQFETVVIDKVRAVQPSTIQHTSLVVKSWDIVGEEAEYVYSPPAAGTLSGNIEPPQNALSFKLVRSTRATRNGSKRIGGYADALVTDGHGSDLSTDTRIVAIQNAIGTPWSFMIPPADVYDMNPVIVRRNASGIPTGTPNPIKAAQYRGLGSQNSRKRLL